jgi:hypothetical protein
MWDEFAFDPRTTDNAAMRASDADRDVVHRLLGGAYADGRLTREEFDERSAATLGARTLGELPPLISDLVPVSPATRSVVPGADQAQLQARAVAAHRRDLREAVWGFISASLICWVIWGVTSGGAAFPWPVFVMLGTGLHALRLLVMRADQVEEHRKRLERKDRKALEQQQRREIESSGGDAT